MNWGACYLDHFAKWFRAPVARSVFEQGPYDPSIQVLSFDGVFEGCRVFATLGLSHYSADIGRVAEIVIPVDDEWAIVPGLVANVLFHMIQTRQHIGRGVAVSGLDRIDPSFCQRVGKRALYLTDIYGLPAGAERVICDGQSGALYLGLFISRGEYEMFRRDGAEGLEGEFERRGVDPYSVGRPSAVVEPD
ncbi:MAG: suppressor of fused domain protein [Fimbriimonadaceae bacterium]|nr:suppressor of fused domain protein [Fimbriimonadaceae bacterium]